VQPEFIGLGKVFGPNLREQFVSYSIQGEIQRKWLVICRYINYTRKSTYQCELLRYKNVLVSLGDLFAHVVSFLHSVTMFVFVMLHLCEVRRRFGEGGW
jgi:hypothetical protein